MAKTLIFHLGTNNWQVEGEAAPGSGILHESHHNAINSMDGWACYSMFPSPMQKATRPDYRVFHIEHPIPICESFSPVSSYRWHSMSEKEFSEYRERLGKEVYEFMNEAEKKEGQLFSLIVAHHSFLNPLVMRDVVRRRMTEGKPRIPIFAFLHGTALKMFDHEVTSYHPEEYPKRFQPLMVKEKIFDASCPDDCVAGCMSVSPAMIDRMCRIFPSFPRERVILAPCGINDHIFYPREGLTLQQVLTDSPLSKPEHPTSLDASKYEHAVVLVAKFSDQKRIDALLMAAQMYETHLPKVCTLIVGGGPVEEKKKYYDLADKLKLKSTFFMGPHSQDIIAQLFSVASVGVLPSFEEPFGMVLVECMACGCPVIAANSGGPATLVNSEVGELVPDPGSYFDFEPLAKSLNEAICRAIEENWRLVKGDACMALAKKYGVVSKVKELLGVIVKFEPEKKA